MIDARDIKRTGLDTLAEANARMLRESAIRRPAPPDFEPKAKRIDWVIFIVAVIAGAFLIARGWI